MNVKALSNDPKQTELASNFTVAQYETACGTQDRDTIAEALRRRFTERNIDPVTPGKDKQMHGLTMMAISCLMIESLESFCRGWKNSKGSIQGHEAGIVLRRRIPLRVRTFTAKNSRKRRAAGSRPRRTAMMRPFMTSVGQ
jgi:hypothetical protein